ncbi:nucleotide sugar dehydrogenase [Dongia sp.]|uniref:nucleotide sugar dehydrogenase n=1 Tax=Dongia sp. TaxID=1977262 RepID=UPI0035B25182
MSVLKPAIGMPPNTSTGSDAPEYVTARVHRHKLMDKIGRLEARVGIVGLGYVGLPLACLFAEKCFPVIGVDNDESKTAELNCGRSYIEHIAHERIAQLRSARGFEASTDMARLADADIVIICVPTPLTRHREPDLQYIEQTGRAISRSLRPGQMIILESSTYPGTTREVLKPLLEASGLRSGIDFFLAYSPEREDPGNAAFGTARIPKIVGGDGAAAREIATRLYDQIVAGAVPVSSPETAEFVKLSENIFRAVNIALANELKTICMAMGVDVWEVIDAAATKPFGFMPFYPGPGLGGHCIPVDPFYLTWKAREFGINTKFIELAGEVNAAMPGFVVTELTRQLSAQQGQALRGARILLLGIAYKKNVDDLRESPALIIYEMLLKSGAMVTYHDPHIPTIKPTREHSGLSGLRSVALNAETIGAADAVLIVTDHDKVDYGLVAAHARLIVDTRNAMTRAGISVEHLVKA